MISKDSDCKKGLNTKVGETFLKELTDSLKKSKKITQEITQTDEYVNWLENFMNQNNKFTDDLAYYSEKLSEYEKKQVSKLSNFYEAIELYANKNFIYGSSDENCNQYKIKHNNVGYEIGVMVGQGTIFWAKKCELTENNSNDFIDFKLIQENKLTNRAKNIIEKLSHLEMIMVDMASESVPVEAIADTTEKSLRLLRQRH